MRVLVSDHYSQYPQCIYHNWWQEKLLYWCIPNSCSLYSVLAFICRYCQVGHVHFRLTSCSHSLQLDSPFGQLTGQHLYKGTGILT